MLLVVLCATMLTRSNRGDVRRGRGGGRHRRPDAAHPDAGAGGRVARRPRHDLGAQPLQQRTPRRAARVTAPVALLDPVPVGRRHREHEQQQLTRRR